MKKDKKTLPVVTIIDDKDGSERKLIAKTYVQGALDSISLVLLRARADNLPLDGLEAGLSKIDEFREELKTGFFYKDLCTEAGCCEHEE